MVTRARIAAGLHKYQSKYSVTTSSTLDKSDIPGPPAIKFCMGAASLLKDVLIHADQPGPAQAVDTAISIARKNLLNETPPAPVTPNNDKLTALIAEWKTVDQEEDPVRYARLDAQIELMQELLNTGETNDG